MIKMKAKYLFLVLLSILIIPSIVSAQTSKPHYTNMNGVELTETQYNNLAKVFDENTIYTMSYDQIDLIKNDTTLRKTSTEQYTQMDTYYDFAGNVISNVEVEISKEQCLNNDVVPTIQPKTSSTLNTSIKKTVLSVITGAIDIRYVTLTTTWYSTPSIKSFDIIAVEFDSKTKLYSPSTSPDTITGYQKWDGQFVNYNANTANTKIVWANQIAREARGVGISMNIVDAVTSSLELSMTVVASTDEAYYSVKGTYQHANQHLTLENSKKYTITTSGIGGLISFTDNNVKNTYDNASGLSVKHYYLDM